MLTHLLVVLGWVVRIGTGQRDRRGIDDAWKQWRVVIFCNVHRAGTTPSDGPNRSSKAAPAPVDVNSQTCFAYMSITGENCLEWKRGQNTMESTVFSLTSIRRYLKSARRM